MNVRLAGAGGLLDSNVDFFGRPDSVAVVERRTNYIGI
jgi:hypothetical protein